MISIHIVYSILYPDSDIHEYLYSILKPYFKNININIEDENNAYIDIDIGSKSKIETKFIIDIIMKNCKLIDIDNLSFIER